MKFRNFVLSFTFLSLFAFVNAQAQLDIRGSVNGRVISANGAGVRRATVSIRNLTTLESQTRTTNDFGYFRFNDLPIFDFYLVTVSSKRNIFTFSSQMFGFEEFEHSMTFTSDN